MWRRTVGRRSSSPDGKIEACGGLLERNREEGLLVVQDHQDDHLVRPRHPAGRVQASAETAVCLAASRTVWTSLGADRG